MKRTITIFILLTLCVSTIAYAGIWGTVTGFVKTEALSLLIGAGLGALGMLGLSYKLWGQAVKELGECVWSIYKATRPDSPGGKSINKAEMEKILKDAAEIYPAVSAAIASHKTNA